MNFICLIYCLIDSKVFNYFLQSKIFNHKNKIKNLLKYVLYYYC